MNMICDNCGSEIDKREEYCPDCGMELPGSAPKPSKRKYHKDQGAFTNDIPQPSMSFENYNEEADYKIKPLKRKYYGDPSPSTYDDPQYQDEVDYESHYTEEANHEEIEESKSIIGTAFLLLIIALLLGFIVGLILFSSNMQSIPQVPGLKS